MKLRPYEAADESALVDVWFEGWRSNRLEWPVVTKAELAARLPRDLAERWTVTVAEREARLAGFVAVCLHERRLDQLFISPESQGCGLGLALFEVARRQMPEGFWLSTHPDNHRARRFYERRGMMLDRIEASPGGAAAIYVFPPPPA
jgi:GNAT superfamily N-acetyltransferase